jgi:hypothetical protein
LKLNTKQWERQQKKHFMDKLIVEQLEMSNGALIELLCDNQINEEPSHPC